MTHEGKRFSPHPGLLPRSGAPAQRPVKPDRRLRWGLRVVFGWLPPAVRRRLAGAPIRRDGQTLDPDLALLLRLSGLGSRRAAPPTVQSRRQQVDIGGPLVGGPADTSVGTTDVMVAGTTNIPCRLYIPDGLAAGSPLLVFYHGGAWVTGSLDSHDRLCRFIAAHAAVRVLSVGYRLAPEHPFPAAFDDAAAAYRYATGNAAAWGADPGLIAVGGDSAGGGLAAAVALRAGRDGGSRPTFLLMFYPHCDTAGRAASRDLFGEGFGLTDEDIEWSTDQYLPAGDDRTDPRVCVARADHLSGMPPTYLVTGGFDPLRDEGELLADRLEAAGVAVIARREPDLMHGFANLLGISPRCREAVAHACGALRTGLEVSRP